MLARTAIARYATALSRSAPTGPHHSIHFGSKNHGRQPGNNGAQDAARRRSTPSRSTAKDFSFENPNAPRSLQPQAKGPQINLQVNVNAKQLAKADFEVDLTLEGNAKIGDKDVLFAFELTYSGVFRVQNIPQDQLHPVIMIECPRLLFPFARQIVADAVRNGGFPPLYIDPIDFVALYRQRASELQGSRAARPPSTPASRPTERVPGGLRPILLTSIAAGGSRCRGGRPTVNDIQQGSPNPHGVQAAAGLGRLRGSRYNRARARRAERLDEGLVGLALGLRQARNADARPRLARRGRARSDPNPSRGAAAAKGRDPACLPPISSI